MVGTGATTGLGSRDDRPGPIEAARRKGVGGPAGNGEEQARRDGSRQAREDVSEGRAGLEGEDPVTGDPQLATDRGLHDDDGGTRR